jgi:hypothetical protein
MSKIFAQPTSQYRMNLYISCQNSKFTLPIFPCLSDLKGWWRWNRPLWSIRIRQFQIFQTYRIPSCKLSASQFKMPQGKQVTAFKASTRCYKQKYYLYHELSIGKWLRWMKLVNGRGSIGISETDQDRKTFRLQLRPDNRLQTQHGSQYVQPQNP